jgi:tetratricopeptide (TPR) repeat protein
MNNDLTAILHGWEHNPNEVTVRRIIGTDGTEKIQMRLDLGVLQMETEGRPDGARPHGRESLLEFYNDRRRRHELRHNSDDFLLTGDECSALKQEAMQYYYRYLSLFHLGDYLGVIRDTQRNLRVFDLIHECAEEENDRTSLEQFRPYVLMMNTRARACLLLEEREFDRALEEIESGIERIENFFNEIEREEMAEHCREIHFLRDWSERIRSNSPLGRLRQKLQVAVEAEDYERAAQLRDEIKEMAY